MQYASVLLRLHRIFVQRAAWATITASWKQVVVTLSNKFRKLPPAAPSHPGCWSQRTLAVDRKRDLNTPVDVKLCFLKSLVTDRDLGDKSPPQTSSTNTTERHEGRFRLKSQLKTAISIRKCEGRGAADGREELPAETSERDQLQGSTGVEDPLPSPLRVCAPPRPPRTPTPHARRSHTSLVHVGTLGGGVLFCVVLDLL